MVSEAVQVQFTKSLLGPFAGMVILALIVGAALWFLAPPAIRLAENVGELTKQAERTNALLETLVSELKDERRSNRDRIVERPAQ